jgi:hypothetical protein
MRILKRLSLFVIILCCLHQTIIAQCDRSCATCSGTAFGNCLTCPSGAFLIRTACCPSANMYYMSGQTSCQSCHSSCATCSGPLDTDCLSCKQGYQVSSSGQCVCMTGTLPSATGCDPCNVSCLTCSGTKDKCTACRSDATLTSTNTCQCNQGFYYDSTTGYCLRCHPSCKTCASSSYSNQCTACGTGATFTPTQGSTTGTCSCSTGNFDTSGNCITCHPTCTSCYGTSESQCLSCPVNMKLQPDGTCKCNPGYALTQTGCARCHSSCATCSTTESNGCISCIAGRALAGPIPNSCICVLKMYMDQTGACQSCHPTCRTCSSDSNASCLSCEVGAVINGGRCVCSSPNMYQDAQTGACYTCHFSCKTCSGPDSTQCLSCNSVSTLTNGVCDCPPGQFTSTDGTCSACHSSCATCKNGLKNGCLTCPTTTSTVSGDPSPSVSFDGQCLCPGATFWNIDKTCQPCSPTCATCTGSQPNMCLTCLDNSNLRNDGTCACIPGYQLTQTSGGFSCTLITSCDSTCQTCSGSLPNNCLTCKSTALLTQNGMCVCPTGFFWDPSTSTCSACTSGCLGCVGTPDTCVSCKTGLVLDTALSPKNCVCSSGIGYFLGPNDTCQACDSKCRACNALSTTCTSCKASLTLMEGVCTCSQNYLQLSTATMECLPNPCTGLCKRCSINGSQCSLCGDNASPDATGCVCNAGFYLSQNTCLPCHLSCATCSGALETNCLTCKDQLTLTSGACPCPAKTYRDTLDGRCRACHSTCDTCSGPKLTDCLTCRPGTIAPVQQSDGSCRCPSKSFWNAQTLLCEACNAKCAECGNAAASGCTSCKANAYLDIDGNCKCLPKFGWNSANECVACHSSCRTCNSGEASNSCTTCDDSALKLTTVEGTCTCPQGLIMQTDGTCTSCNKDCTTCNSVSNNFPNACLGCADSSKTLASNTCTCRVGTFLAADGSCASCHATCATCTTPSINGCLTCPYNFVLVSGRCICATAGYFVDTSASQINCNACEASCKTCSGATAYSCTSCKDQNASIRNGQCICSIGMYKDANGACQTCDSTCLTCSGAGPTLCTSCRPNEFLTSSGCVCNNGLSRDANNNCVNTACHPTCATCTSGSTLDTQCTKCLVNANFASGTSSPNKCVCDQGFIMNSFGQCLPCHDSCSTCTTSPNTCATCKQNSALNSITGLCLCQTGFYWNFLTKLCEACHSTCGTCAGPSFDQCLTCKTPLMPKNGFCGCAAGAFLSSTGECLPCSTSCNTCVDTANTCVTCKQGATLVGHTCVCTATSGNCGGPVCHSSCLTCSGTAIDECQSCRAGSFMSNGMCKCPSGKVMKSDGTCVNCHPTCLTCTSELDTACTSCKPKASLSTTGKCTCNNSYDTIDATSGLCVSGICHPTCSLCLADDATKCLVCKNGVPLALNTCACPSGSYADNQGKCFSCHPSCGSCTGPNSNQCTGCKPDALPVSNGVCSCGPRSYMSVAGSCQPCHGSCETCSSGSPSSCITCKAGSAIDSVTKLCKCSQNMFFSPDFTCMNLCHQTCLTCNGPLKTNCATCQSGATLSSTKECTCPSGTFMDGQGYCKPCDPSCLSCTGPSPKECTACKSQGVLTSSGSCACAINSVRTIDGGCTSIACHSSCLTCNGPAENQCLTCNPFSVLTVEKKCACLSSYYRPPQGNCASCSTRCAACTNSGINGCTACKPNAVLNSDGTCSCLNGFVFNMIDDCVPVECHPSCATCSGPSEYQCLTCNSDATLASDGRCKCNTALYQDPTDFTCKSCFDTCNTCNGPLASNCLTCYNNAVLSGGVCNCKLKHYLTPNYDCLPCDMTCATCTGDTPNSCTSCPLGSELLTDNSCRCLNNFTYDMTNGKCVALGCHNTCYTCSNGQVTGCKSCKPFASLQSDGSCKCFQGYAFDAYGNCLPTACDSACETCDTSGVNGCLTCKIGAQLSNSPRGACQCLPGTYMDVYGLCQNCYSSCNTCSSPAPDKCTSCKANASLQGGTCVCNPGYVVNILGNCVPCHTTCATCNTELYNGCLTCNPLASRKLDGSCECQPSFTMTTSGLCTYGTCHYSCLTCSGPSDNECQSCKLGAYRDSNAKCVCKSGQPMNSDGTCLVCHPTCATCSGTLEFNCLSCPPLSELKNGACVCKPFHFFDAISGYCQPCHYSCGSCTGSLPSQCVTCKGTNVALDLNNQCKCSPYYLMEPDGVCRACASTCKTCDLPTNKCATCQTGATLNSKGDCTCDTGFYLDPQGFCVPCHASCQTCFGAGSNQCSSCKFNARLVGTNCLCSDGSLGDKQCKTCPYGSFMDWESGLCTKCNEAYHCTSCETIDVCTSCVEGFTLTSDKKCKIVYFTQQFSYSIQMINDQIILRIKLSLNKADMERYLKLISRDDLLSVNRPDGSSLADTLSWQKLPTSKYEWQGGIVRFKISVLRSVQAFDCIMEAKPTVQPPAIASATSGRILESTTSEDRMPKKFVFPTTTFIDPTSSNAWYVVFSILYILVIAMMFFLIVVRPFNKSLRNSVKTFWFAQNVMWLQVIYLTGYLAVDFKGGLDNILLNIAESSLKYFGADLEFAFIPGTGLEDIRNAYYVGKYTSQGKTPYVFQKMFIPASLYVISWIISFLPLGQAREFIVAFRSGLCCSYAIQFTFICAINFVAFFGGGAFNGFTVVGFIIALGLLALVWIEIAMMRVQMYKQETKFLVNNKTKGLIVFDSINHSKDVKVKIYKGFYFGEAECLIAISLVTGLLGRAALPQILVNLAFCFAVIVPIFLVKQDFKILKLSLAVSYLLVYLLNLIYCFFGTSTSLDLVKIMTYIYMLFFCLTVTIALAIGILRVYNLLKPNYAIKEDEPSESSTVKEDGSEADSSRMDLKVQEVIEMSQLQHRTPSQHQPMSHQPNPLQQSVYKEEDTKQPLGKHESAQRENPLLIINRLVGQPQPQILPFPLQPQTVSPTISASPSQLTPPKYLSPRLIPQSKETPQSVGGLLPPHTPPKDAARPVPITMPPPPRSEIDTSVFSPQLPVIVKSEIVESPKQKREERSSPVAGASGVVQSPQPQVLKAEEKKKSELSEVPTNPKKRFEDLDSIY